jgi:hypothetical protein
VPGSSRCALIGSALLLLIAFLALASDAGAAPPGSGHGAGSASESRSAHYIVFEIDEHGDFHPVFHRVVTLARPPRSLSDAELVRAERRERPGRKPVRVQLRGPQGEVVFRSHLEAPTWIRGEFHGAAQPLGGNEIESHLVVDPQSAFVVRVPAGLGRTLVLEGQERGVFDLDALAAAAPEPEPPAAAALLSSTATGDPANRLDLLMLGDGYSAAQAALFAADAAWFEDSFFAITPYAEYRSHVNVHTLFTPSAQSGADHPHYDPACSISDPSCCPDPASQGDLLGGSYVDTAFDARYCGFGIYRLVAVDTSSVLAAAAAQPDWDHIMVLVNDDTYGGAGYGGGPAIAVSSTNAAAPDVVRHEFGHSFSGLADEYESSYPGYPGCSDVAGASSCEPNVTDETHPSRVKWLPWIDAQTPIPTPETMAYNGVVGLFEGARYQASGMYRPRRFQCLMRQLGMPFCAVCRQSFVLALYQGWAGSAQGIDPIEPGSETPPPGVVATDLCGRVLSAQLLEPAGGPPLAVSWEVDGVPMPGAQAASFAFAPAAPGSYDVTLRVEDVTPLVHPDLAGDALVSTRSWQLDVSAQPCTTSSPPGCGIGPELCALLPALAWARGRRAR